MLKLKQPLLALSISAAFIMPSTMLAAPINILPLGDSITNGLHNEGDNDPVSGNVTDGTKLSYRDDLYDLMKASGKVYGTDFTFFGSCESADSDGECNAPKPNHDGKSLKHEGRAGYTADRINEEVGTWLDDNYGGIAPDITLLHIGTNDIYNDETPSSTLVDIKNIVNKLLAKYSDMEIYIAKILPMGDPAGANAAVDSLNSLLTQGWANSTWPGKNIKIVDMNNGIETTEEFFTSDLVHPKQKTEVIMAQRWFDAINGNTADPTKADPAQSTLTATPITVTANNDETSIITLQAINSSGNNITTGGAAVTFQKNMGNSVTMSQVVDNQDGTYTVTVKRNRYAGKLTVSAKIAGVSVTDKAYADFKAGQEIKFPANNSEEYAKDKSFSLSNLGNSVIFGSNVPTTLPVTLAVKLSSSSVCSMDGQTKVKVRSAGNCVLVATQAGGNVNDANLAPKAQSPVTSDTTEFGAAKPVEQTIVIKKATQKLTFTNTPATAYIQDIFPVTVTNTSNLPVSIKTTTPNICSLDAAGKVTITATGACFINASQAGDNNHKPATPVTHKITVLADKITFPSISTKTSGGATFEVIAKSSSGAKVVLTSETPQICTVSGTKVKPIAPGTCELKATSDTASATTTITIAKNKSELAIDSVAKVISGSGSITVEQLEAIKGLKNLKKGRDYTKALKAGTYKDKKHPTVAEIQKVIDKANSDSNKSGGSTSPLWLIMLGFVSLLRRRAN